MDDMCYVRKKCDVVRIEKNEVYSEWSPMRGIIVECLIVPDEHGHTRKYKIKSSIECMAYDCGFASKETVPHIRSKNGNFKLITCEANTNLSSTNTFIQAMEYRICIGENVFETYFENF